MNKKRLLKLADFLETVPEDRFDMKEWLDTKDPDPQTLECGTVACAAGWACAIPEFREAGLRLSKGVIDNKFSLYFDTFSDADALRTFFGEEFGCHKDPVFFAASYSSPPTPKQVAKRIRLVVAGKYKK